MQDSSVFCRNELFPIDGKVHKALGVLKKFDPEMHCDRLHDLQRNTKKYINYETFIFV